MEQPCDPARVAAQYRVYEVQSLIPAQNAIGGKAYWSALKLPNDRMHTDSLESAQDYFETAQKNFAPNTVRFVRIETTVVSSP